MHVMHMHFQIQLLLAKFRGHVCPGIVGEREVERERERERETETESISLLLCGAPGHGLWPDGAMILVLGSPVQPTAGVVNC